MTADRPLLIATLPGRTIDELSAQLGVALRAGADVAEVRLDRLDASERPRLSRLFPAALPLLATLRSRKEGGEGPDDPRERESQLAEAAQLPFLWIDLEEGRDRALADRLASSGHSIEILSTHLRGETTAVELVGRARAPLENGAVRKLVVPASVSALLGEILPALRAAALGSVVVLSTGASGPLLRAWAMRLGYPFVFASLPVERSPSAASAVEPSQIPVDRLRFFFDGGGKSPLFALLGHPVAHSQSPYLHSRWMRSSGERGLYVALDIGSEAEFVESLAPLASMGFRGANVTHPWKSAALASATRVGRGAELCGTANCLSLDGDDVTAENTDLVAMLRRLEELRADRTWDGSELAVVGAGGAAAATLAAAREVGARAFVLARSPERATGLADRFGAALLSEPRPFSLVVHATDVGRSGSGPLRLPLARLLAPGGRTLDWVYSPDDPAVRSVAENAGATYEDGWRLLAYQAAASFGLWWGTEPAAEELERTIAEGPCAA